MIRRILLVFICCACGAMAQDQDRLAAYKARIAADQEALATLNLETARQQQALERNIQQKATELLNLQLKLRDQQQATAETTQKSATGTDAQSNRKKQAQDILASASSLGNQLDIILSELPGREADRKALDPTAIEAFLGVLNQLHDDAAATTVRTTQLHQADGHPIEAQLLSLSNAHFAYTDGNGNAAVAVQSPADATGFRWQDQLSPGNQDAVKQAVADVSSGQETSIPADVTATLRLESWSTQSSLSQQVRSGGPLMIPIAIVALLAGILMLERLFVWFSQRGRPSAVVDALHACEAADYVKAEQQLQANRGISARLILAALERRNDGQEAMEDSIEVRLLEEVPRLRHRLNGIAVLGGVAPLLGLLGTVTGIIETFAVIRMSGTTDVGLMAGGISQALVTTAAGLIVAIPILLLHRVLAGAMDRLVSDAESQAATALTILSKEDS